MGYLSGWGLSCLHITFETGFKMFKCANSHVQCSVTGLNKCSFYLIFLTETFCSAKLFLVSFLNILNKW